MSLTKRLWRMLPMALLIVLVAASAVFAANEPYDLKITEIGTVVADDFATDLPEYCSVTAPNDEVAVDFEFYWDNADGGVVAARVELVNSNGEVAGTNTVGTLSGPDVNKKYTSDANTFEVQVPGDAVDFTRYSVRLVVTVTHMPQVHTDKVSVANAVEIDLSAPPIAGIMVDPASPMNNTTPTFTWVKPTDGRAGVATTDYGYQYVLTNTPTPPTVASPPWSAAEASAGDVTGDATKNKWTAPALGDAEQWYFHIVYKDKFENISDPATFGPFIVDKNAPALALKTLFTKELQPIVIIEATEPGLGISGLDVNSGAFTLTDPSSNPIAGTGSWSASAGNKWLYSWKPSADLTAVGNYTVSFTGVKDLAGNVATTLSGNLVVDRAKPTFGAKDPSGLVYVDTDMPAISVKVKDAGKAGLDLDVKDMWVSGVGTVTGPVYSGPGLEDYYTLTWTPTTSIGQGVKTVRVRAVDKAGNEATETWEFTVDSEPPTLALTSPALVTVGADKYITTLTPVVTVTATDDGSGVKPATGTFKIEISGGADITADGTGAWSGTAYTWTLTAPNKLDEANTYVVTMTNVEDNAGKKATESWTFKVDATAPTITIDAKGDKGSGAAIAADGWTNDPGALEPKFTAALSDSGSGLDESSITVTLNGTTVPKKVGTADGWELGGSNVTYIPDEPLAEGWHVFAVTVRDKAGNGKTETFEFGVDIVEPKLEKTNPVGWTNTLRPEVVITAREETSGLAVDPTGKIICTFTITGSSSGNITANGEGTWDASGLVFAWKLKDASTDLKEEEEYTVRMGGISDKATNACVPDPLTWSFRIDTKAPKITVLEPDEEYTGGKPLIKAKVVDEGFSEIDQATIVMKIDGEQVGHAFAFSSGEVTYTPAANLPDGERTVTLDVKDKAGNAATQAEWKFKVDTIGPTDPTGLGVGNLGDNGIWYINALLSTFRWNTSEDPDAPDGTPGSGLCCYPWEFGLKETLPEEGEDWDDAIWGSYRMATPGEDVEQLTIPFGLLGGLSADVEYAFRVRANDDLHNGSDWSEPITFVYDPNPPTAVTDLMGDPNPENPYPNFSWTAATDPISGVAGYVIRIKTKGGASWDAFDKFVDFPDGATGTLAWQLKVKLDPGQYTMSIAAQDVAGNVGPAMEIDFSVEAPSIVPVISVLKPTEGSYKINEISTIKFQVVDRYDEDIVVEVEGATLAHIVTIVNTPTLNQFYLLLDPQPGDLKITITVGEVTETFSYTVEAERSGFGFGRLRPW